MSPDPVGLALVDRLEGLATVSIEDYVQAASEYVMRSREVAAGPKKAAQSRLSNGLGRALVSSIKEIAPELNAHVGERTVAGALRPVQADVSEFDELDGLRLAIELKPINLAVGRAIWNRFGDIRTFAVNIHLKFPFCVVGGVIALPLTEEKNGRMVSTRHLIERLCHLLVRAGRRRSESDAAHRMEGVAVIAYDPESATIDPMLPSPQSGLRWEQCAHALAKAYDDRFGDGELLAEMAREEAALVDPDDPRSSP